MMECPDLDPVPNLAQNSLATHSRLRVETPSETPEANLVKKT